MMASPLPPPPHAGFVVASLDAKNRFPLFRAMLYDRAMADIINLRLARKAKARDTAEKPLKPTAPNSASPRASARSARQKAPA
jgi:hypothetical protein